MKNDKAQKPFAVFDIDGTLIRWQLYHAIADALVRLGYFDKDIFKSVKEARMVWKNRGYDQSYKDYERSLVIAYDQMLTKITVEQFNEAARQVFNEYKDQTYTYTRELIKELKNSGYFMIAISGSQSEIVEMIATHYGFDDFAGSTYAKANGRFVGTKKVITGTNKVTVLESFVSKHKLGWKKSYCVGDSESDIPLLEKVDKPIAFNPNKLLHERARHEGWQIVVERKNVVYRLEDDHGTYILA